MALEDRRGQHDGQVVDKYAAPEADYEMSTRDYVVRPSASNASNAFTITLPPVNEAKGRFYSIVARQADAVNTVTITDDDDSECWLGDIVLDGKCDRVLLYSDGLCWHPLTGNPGDWPGFSTTAAPGTSEAPTTVAPTTVRSQSTEAPTTTLTTEVPTTTLTTVAG